MAVTSEQVKQALDREDYDMAAQLGPDALPHLMRFVEGGEPGMAAKAAYLAGRIGDPKAGPILELAASSDDPVVRAGAAGGVQFLPDEQADSVLLRLVDDDDPGVRKTALRAVPASPSRDLSAKVDVLREHDDEPALRALAGEVADRGPGDAKPAP